MRKALAALAIVAIVIGLVLLRVQARNNVSEESAAPPSRAPMDVSPIDPIDEPEATPHEVATETPEPPSLEPTSLAVVHEEDAMDDPVDEEEEARAANERIVDSVVQTVEKLLEAGIAGDLEAAQSVSEPGSSVAEDAESFGAITS